MVSPELLRRYPFFAGFDNTHIKAIAMVADEFSFEKDDSLYEIDKPADALFVLVDGIVEHYFIVVNSQDARLRKEFYLSDITPGEVFGLSSMIDPYKHTTTARCAREGHAIRIQTASLLTLGELDSRFAYSFMNQIAKALSEKLESTRVQLAASRA